MSGPAASPGTASDLTARRAPAQQRPGRTGVDHAVFRDTTLGDVVAADVLPFELSWCVCMVSVALRKSCPSLLTSI